MPCGPGFWGASRPPSAAMGQTAAGDFGLKAAPTAAAKQAAGRPAFSFSKPAPRPQKMQIRQDIIVTGRKEQGL